MQVIELYSGHHVKVDDDYYGPLNQFTWYLRASRNGSKPVVYRKDSKDRRKKIYMHNVVMPLKGAKYIKHLNGNGQDNRRENLVRVFETIGKGYGSNKPSNYHKGRCGRRKPGTKNKRIMWQPGGYGTPPVKRDGV